MLKSLYQVNTRVWLTDLSRALGRPATLDDVPDRELDRWAARGFHWIWFLSVWSTGAAGQHMARTIPAWRREFARTLSDLREEDIAGSGFAIIRYTASPALGGDAALARLRQRLHQRGLRLLLDFVPNHTGLDHPWLEEHPEYYLAGTAADLQREPRNYTQVRSRGKNLILAHGRDPHFPAWSDTLQLDYSKTGTQEAMLRELEKVAAQCDGVRCDMAMLVLPEIFERTWGRRTEAFWPRAIQQVRAWHPGFCFLAEVYWDLEMTLLRQGFDYAYDKRLYDHLIGGVARPVRAHLRALMGCQNQLVRFLENHDEPRAAASFPPEMHKAAAVTTYFSPGLRFFHQGQLEGRRKRVSAHLVRAPREPADKALCRFYTRLLKVLQLPQVRSGVWQLLECAPAWERNSTWDCFIVFAWHDPVEEPLLIVVNYAPHSSQCYVKLPWANLAGRTVRLRDLFGPARYDREGCSLISTGLYLDLPPWGYHVLALGSIKERPRRTGEHRQPHSDQRSR